MRGMQCVARPNAGGLASALNEIATAARVQVDIDDASIPVRDDIRGACEILGLDPLYLANEGRFVAFVSPATSRAPLKSLAPTHRLRTPDLSAWSASAHPASSRSRTA